MIKYLRILVLFFIFPISGENLRVVTSRDLKGNIKACTCTAIPISGLAGRGSFLESIQINPKTDLLLELGNYIGPAISREQFPALFEGFLALGYHSLGLSEMELKNISTEAWDKMIYQPVSSNLNSLSGEPSFKTIETFYRNGNVIHFLSFYFPSFTNRLGEVYLSSLSYTPVNQKLNQIVSEKTGNLWILSFFGTMEELETLNLPDKIKNKLIILNTDTPNLEESKISKKLGKVFIQRGENGDELNLFEFTPDLKFVKRKRVLLDAEKLKENSKISSIIQKYNIK